MSSALNIFGSSGRAILQNSRFLPSNLNTPRIYMMSSFVEKKIQLNNGQNINFVRDGSGDQAVLLLPGALGHATTDFSPTIRGINTKDKLTVIAWDPPGYGKSRPFDRSFSLDFFQRDAECASEFMDKLGFKRWNAVGWSDGGITALIAAVTFQHKIQKVVVWGTNAHITDVDIGLIENVRDVSKWSERMRKPMEETYGVSGFPKLWSDWCDAYKTIYDQNGGEIVSKRLKDIACPTLIIHGDKDSMLDPCHPDVLHKSIPNSRLERFSDGKHNLHFKYKDQFNKLVEDFLIEN